MKKNSHNSLNNKWLHGTVPFVKYWLPVYVYAILIFIYSSLSQPPLTIKILYGDKLFHLIEYAILGYLLARAAKNSAHLKLNAHFRIFAVCFAIIYGLSDELHQYFVPLRQPEVLDLLVNGLGGFLGQLLFRGK